MKIQINGRTLTKKGLATLVLAGTIAINAVGYTAYKAMETVADAVVVEETAVVDTVEVQVAWGTEVPTVWEAITHVNPDINGFKRKQAMSMVHELNGTAKYTGWEQDMPAGTYIIPVIK